MKRQTTDNWTAVQKAVRYLAMEKGKVVVATCLIGVMVFLWVRLLTRRHTARQVQAALRTQAKLGPANSVGRAKIKFVELPEVKGRNDILTRDFFAPQQLEQVLKGQHKEPSTRVNILATGGKQSRNETILRLVRELKLDATATGKKTLVYVNNKLLPVGGRLQVEDASQVYEFDVVAISENEVVLSCEGLKFELKVVPDADTRVGR
jgi:hypothetical protein